MYSAKSAKSDGNDALVKKQLQHALQTHLRLVPGIEPHLAGALRETLRHPGSMVRALLAFRIATSFGLPDDQAEHLAIAIEYFHTASLLFDDLPCMDDAKHRRGVPCVHETFGQGAAILAALALINRAYALLWSAVSGLPADVQSRSLSYVEQHLGLSGLLNGQSQDLHYTDLHDAAHSSDARLPQRIALGKTVSLIRLSVVLPGLLGQATSDEIRLLDRLAVVWGLSYQTLDDLKDVLQTLEGGGKTVARDAHLNRPNLALTIGVEDSFRRVDRLMRLGDRVIARLSRRQPLTFLASVRAQFEKEIASLLEAQLALAS